MQGLQLREEIVDQIKLGHRDRDQVLETPRNPNAWLKNANQCKRAKKKERKVIYMMGL
jgi:hypothetical protein